MYMRTIIQEIFVVEIFQVESKIVYNTYICIQQICLVFDRIVASNRL